MTLDNFISLTSPTRKKKSTTGLESVATVDSRRRKGGTMNEAQLNSTSLCTEGTNVDLEVASNMCIIKKISHDAAAAARKRCTKSRLPHSASATLLSQCKSVRDRFHNSSKSTSTNNSEINDDVRYNSPRKQQAFFASPMFASLRKIPLGMSSISMNATKPDRSSPNIDDNRDGSTNADLTLTTTSCNDSPTSSNPHPEYLQEFLDDLLTQRGYSIRKFVSTSTAYLTTPTPLQLASHDVHLIKLCLRRAHHLRGAASVNEDSNKPSQSMSHVATELDKLLQTGLVSPNACNKHGESLLQKVVRRGDDELYRLLVTHHGASVQVCDQLGRTLAHDACTSNKFPGETAMMDSQHMYAMNYGTFGIMNSLLKLDRDLLFLTDARGKTPLMYVRNEDWNLWQTYLSTIVDEIWPSRNASSQQHEVSLPLTLLPPFSRVILDPSPWGESRKYTDELTIPTDSVMILQLTSRIASGRLDPEAARHQYLLIKVAEEKRQRLMQRKECPVSPRRRQRKATVQEELLHRTDPNKKGDSHELSDASGSSLSDVDVEYEEPKSTFQVRASPVVLHKPSIPEDVTASLQSCQLSVDLETPKSDRCRPTLGTNGKVTKSRDNTILPGGVSPLHHTKQLSLQSFLSMSSSSSSPMNCKSKVSTERSMNGNSCAASVDIQVPARPCGTLYRNQIQ
jgi:hypothetical protein